MTEEIVFKQDFLEGMIKFSGEVITIEDEFYITNVIEWLRKFDGREIFLGVEVHK